MRFDLRATLVLLVAASAGCEATVITPGTTGSSGSAAAASSTSGTTSSTAASSTSSTGTASSTTSSSSSSTSTASSTTSSSTSSTTTTTTTASSSSGSGTTTTSTTTASSSSSGSTTGCTPACGANARCESGQCVCEPGYTAGASGCEPVAPGDPTTHSQTDVCQAWSAGHVENASSPFTAGSGGTCDPGSLPSAALDDALRRLNMFRWMVGEGPSADDSSLDANDQACAIIAADNPASAAAHNPDPSWTCYTSAGASGCGSSNIAWGCASAAGAMDQWVQDWGNETTLGHRRWILNPPLDPVGIGFYEGGSGPYPEASCLGVFGMSGTGPHPSWYSWPPAGFVPSDAVYTIWSLHSGSLGVDNASIAITQLSDGGSVPVTVQTLSQGYGEDAISWTIGVSPQPGETYRVAVSNLASAPDFTYDVSVVTCP